MSDKKRIGILISGRGSNMRSLIKACEAPDYPARIVTVISNRPQAPGLETATRAGIATTALDHKTHDSRSSFERDLHQALVEADVELICNAGFMRLLTHEFVEKWRDRQLNIHPSLLPAFKGLDTHQRALDAGVRIAGCTVHVVRTKMDAGPIVAQASVPVMPGDDADSLAARVLAAEHRLYPHALELVASGRAVIEGEKVILQDSAPETPPLFSPSLS